MPSLTLVWVPQLWMTSETCAVSFSGGTEEVFSQSLWRLLHLKPFWGFHLCAVQSRWKCTFLTSSNPVFPCCGNQSGSVQHVANVVCFGLVFNWILALCFRVPFDQLLCVYVLEVCYMHLGLWVCKSTCTYVEVKVRRHQLSYATILQLVV